MMEYMTDEELTELVDQKVAELCEHFDSVQILVSWPSDKGNGNTKDYFSGRGNWYARTGMAHDFLNRDRGMVMAKEIKIALKEGND
jgi:hypothetical protein